MLMFCTLLEHTEGQESRIHVNEWTNRRGCPPCVHSMLRCPRVGYTSQYIADQWGKAEENGGERGKTVGGIWGENGERGGGGKNREKVRENRGNGGKAGLGRSGCSTGCTIRIFAGYFPALGSHRVHPLCPPDLGMHSCRSVYWGWDCIQGRASTQHTSTWPCPSQWTVIPMPGQQKSTAERASLLRWALLHCWKAQPSTGC